MTQRWVVLLQSIYQLPKQYIGLRHNAEILKKIELRGARTWTESDQGKEVQLP